MTAVMKNMFFKKFASIFIVLFILTPMAEAQHPSRQIAITIDDLPFVGESKIFHLNMIIDALKTGEVPATGFIIAGNVVKNSWPILHKFREAGLSLGNHTYTHINLNKVNVDRYIHEIDEADRTLQPIMSEPKYFRYPYLAMSKGTKKEQVLRFLSSKNYQVAPVTIDSKDFIFNKLLLSVPEKGRRPYLPAIKVAYLDFIWQQTLAAEERDHLGNRTGRPQILLIHANLLNAFILPDIINLYRQNGFAFISLEEALKSSPENPNEIPKPQEIAKSHELPPPELTKPKATVKPKKIIKPKKIAKPVEIWSDPTVEGFVEWD